MDCSTCEIKAKRLDPGHLRCRQCIECGIAGSCPRHLPVLQGGHHKPIPMDIGPVEIVYVDETINHQLGVGGFDWSC